MIPSNYVPPSSAEQDDSGSWCIEQHQGMCIEQRVCSTCGEHFILSRREIEEAELVFHLVAFCPVHRDQNERDRYKAWNDGRTFEHMPHSDGIVMIQSRQRW